MALLLACVCTPNPCAPGWGFNQAQVWYTHTNFGYGNGSLPTSGIDVWTDVLDAV